MPTNAAGAPFARYTYDPYGAVLSQDTDAAGDITAGLASAIATRQPLRYAGYVCDAHSTTYYLSQRHYDPATMRFLTKDPARDDGEESAYQYCAGDPVGKVDPTGLWAVYRCWHVQRTYNKNTVRLFAAGMRAALGRHAFKALTPATAALAVGVSIVAGLKAGAKGPQRGDVLYFERDSVAKYTPSAHSRMTHRAALRVRHWRKASGSSHWNLIETRGAGYANAYWPKTTSMNVRLAKPPWVCVYY